MMFRVLARKLEKSLRTRGVLGTLRFGGAWIVAQPNRLLRRAFGATKSLAQADKAFDELYDVDTGGIIPLSELAIESDNWVYGVHYEAVSPSLDFDELFDGLDIRYEASVFVDLGCGKGRALLLAASLPFRRVVGVEFSGDLARVASRNLARWPSDKRRCSDASVIHLDASKYEFPPEPMVVFMYNPFGPEVMAKVLSNLRVAWGRYGQRVVVVYFTPKHSSLLDEAGFLERAKQGPGFVIYDTHQARDCDAVDGCKPGTGTAL